MTVARRFSMTKEQTMTDGRLAEIEARHAAKVRIAPITDWGGQAAHEDRADLLAEVRRLRSHPLPSERAGLVTCTWCGGIGSENSVDGMRPCHRCLGIGQLLEVPPRQSTTVPSDEELREVLAQELERFGKAYADIPRLLRINAEFSTHSWPVPVLAAMRRVATPPAPVSVTVTNKMVQQFIDAFYGEQKNVRYALEAALLHPTKEKA